MQKFIPGLFVILLLPCQLIAQEYSLYNNYYLKPFVVNPAFTGTFHYPVFDLSAKKQWLGIPESPSTYALSGNYRIGTYNFYDPKGFINTSSLSMKDRTGLGASFVHDRNGPIAHTGILISYAYHFPVTSETEMSFGLSSNFSYYSFNESVLKPVQPDDIFLYSGNQDQFRYNFNLGGSIHHPTYFVGISVLTLLPDHSDYNPGIDVKPTLFIMGGYKHLLNKTFTIEPAITLRKIRSEKLTIDLYTKLYFNRKNWVAASYSSSGKLGLMMGIPIRNHLFAGYSFEYSLSKISQYTFATHEIMIGWNLGLYSLDGI